MRSSGRNVAARVRRAGWPRVAYECGLALLLGVGGALVNITFAIEEMELQADPLRLTAAGVFGFVTAVAAWLFRLVRPLSALVLGGLLAIPTGGASFTLIALSASVGYRAWRFWPIVLSYLAVLVCSVAGMALQTDNGLPFVVLVALTLYSAVVVVPGAIGAMVAQRRLLVMTMHERNLELYAERKLAVGQAQARERNRIAAELHDSLGHRLTLISLYAGGLAQAPSQAEPQQQAVGMLRDTSAQAMGELRQILKILHQDGPDEATGRSLSEVEETVAAARGTGTEVELVRVGPSRPLSLLAEHAGYRVVQEGLTNALKHAGGAPVRVEVRYEDDALFVEVRNAAGRPYEGQSTGQGLAGLAERVRLAGGVLSSGTVDAGGFRISAVLPYGAEVPGAAAPEDQGDFPQDIERSSRRQRIGVIAVISASVLSLASCIGASVVPTAPETVPQSVFDQAQVGQSDDVVRENLPFETVTSTGDYESVLCETWHAEDSPDDVELRYEFCFENYELISKRVIEVRKD